MSKLNETVKTEIVSFPYSKDELRAIAHFVASVGEELTPAKKSFFQTIELAVYEAIEEELYDDSPNPWINKKPTVETTVDEYMASVSKEE